MKDSLLGKKRDTNEETSPKKENESKEEEKKSSLFGNAPSEGGLFGNINKENSLFGNGSKANKPLFGNFSFNNNNSTSLFSQRGSLFSDPKITKGSSLFSSIANQPSSIFADKNEDNEEEENDSEIFPEETDGFKPTETVQAVDSEYNRLYSKNIDNFFVLNSGEQKFISKGKGQISLEQHKVKTKNYHLVFRNTLGNVIFNGFITSHMKPAEKILKNYKNISALVCLEIVSGKPLVRFCRIPYSKEEEVNEFNEEFNSILKKLKNDSDENEKSKEEKKEEDKDKKK